MGTFSSLFDNAPALSIGIIGDLCVDAYYFLSPNDDQDAGEISVETGKQTRSVEKYYFDLGGAANVALNLKMLRVGRVEVFGIRGDDSFGTIMDGLFARHGIINNAVVQVEHWATHVYSKIYRDGEEEPRLDIGNFNVPTAASIEALITGLEKSLPTLDVVIINEQVGHGFHTPELQAALRGLIARYNKCLWFSDCRNLNDVYNDTIHKINEREAGSRTIEQLFECWQKPVIITRGEDGAVAFDGERRCEVPGIHIINQIDTVGAGDAFFAALTLAFAQKVPLDKAIALGNFAAAVSVQKLFQTGHPLPEEIEAISVSPDYRYNPALAASPHRAEFISHTDIEIISKPAPEAPQIAIFDHDGTISTLRLGWETVMEEVMLRCISGKHLKILSTRRFEAVRSAARNFIARTTGIQTLIQMAGLVKMVADYGFVPQSEILDPQGYKHIYNEALLEMVDKRVRLLEKGSFSPDDFTIKGAVPFLRRLHKAGVQLYLASGTDAVDVRREAALLGYDNCFTHIYGAVGDIKRDPKQAVLEQIMGELGENTCLAVFGDGPVEIREARKHGAVAIGLVSDEKQRFGINPAKRSRLVLAGADVLIPDFSEADELMAWLGWGW